jgi:hypothetical protein
MSQDERGTVRTLSEQKEAMSNLIQEYKEAVKAMGFQNPIGETVTASNKKDKEKA